MNPLRAIRAFLGRRPAPSDDAVVREVVRSVGRDEVSLSFGLYITDEDIARMKAEVLAHDFTSGRRR